MKIKKTIDNHLCLGCGLCKSLHPNTCEMKINESGFYLPKFNTPLTEEEDKQLSVLCPSIHVYGNAYGKSRQWGNIMEITESWSSDGDIRYHAASGGATTSIAIYLLKSKYVDAILQVGNSQNDYLLNELKVSETVEEVTSNAQSRYAPALVFDRILQILQSDPDKTYAFIGKPCDVAAIRNLQAVYPEFKERIKLCISIFCAGMPSYNATIKAWKKSGKTDSPESLKYRGDGWPGYFKAIWKDGSEYKMNYNDSWGKILGRDLGLRCKVCPDGIGELADIAIGDAWNTQNGFPDFTEQPGKCFVMIRTSTGLNVYNKAVETGHLTNSIMDIKEISIMQPYQSQRRKLTFWRLLPLQIKTGFLMDFKGLGIIKLGLSENPIKGIKTLIGSCRRIFQNG